MEKFVHLHVHTEYSILDGCARISSIVKLAKERGYPALAITDHGNMYGVMNFYKECLANGIKPIIGSEFYVCDDRFTKTGKDRTGHLILIAKDNEGYKNLLFLSSTAFVDGFYYKPRIDYKVLKEHSRGLICLSGCLAGHIQQHLLHREKDEAEKLALKLKEMFDEGDFYIELQNHGIQDQLEILPLQRDLAKKIGVKTVVTNDVHYTFKEDWEMQDVMMCVQMGKQIDDPDRMRFETHEFYFKTYEELLDAFPNDEESLKATLEIADKCDVIIRAKVHGEMGFDEKYCLAPSENFIPDYHAPDGLTTYEYMRQLTFDGLRRRYGNDLPENVVSRAEMELTTIKEQGFVEYFLVVWDYINYAKNNNIPVGPGRGSGAGSVVAYAMGITDIDPLRFNLFFERFINKERVSMPDFDIDFDYDRRGEVIEYVRRKYGADHVALIITFGTMAAKNAIRDVARVMKMPYSEVDKISKEIPNKLPDGIKHPPVLKYYFGTTGDEKNDKYIVHSLRAIYENDDFVKKIVDLAIKLEGMPRNCSTHAAGVLIAPDKVVNFVPLAKNGDEVSTQFNMIELETLGLLKMDFLGLRTLTDIDKAIQYVKLEHGVEIDFHKLGYSDSKVYDMISSGNTEAVFQLESGGMKSFMKDLRPDCIEDIIAGVSLYRPGPMDSIPKYIENKRNPEKIIYVAPCLEPILDVTYGCIVYQEQVMKIFQEMGGYSLGQADNVRRIMSKKKKDKMELERVKFINGWEDPEGKKSIEGAVARGVPAEVANDVFNDMASFASYAFNKSHAAAYALLTYQTAYLKLYYEAEFLSAVLNNRITNSDEIKKYVNYARSEKINVLEPDINKSGTYFSVENGDMRFGLSALKNVGIGVIDSIINEREKNGDFKDFMDFAKRVDAQALNKRCLESLILSGAFDCFKRPRSQLMAVYELVVNRVNKDRKNKQDGQVTFFDEEVDGGIEDKIEYPNIKEFSKELKLRFEKEIMGVYLSGHPLDEFMSKFKEFNCTSDMLNAETTIDEFGEEVQGEISIADGSQIICGGIISEIKKVNTKASNREMAIIKVEDLYGSFECMLFPAVYDKLKAKLIVDTMATIIGKLSIRDGERPTILVDNILPWVTQAEIVETKKVYVKMNTTNEDLMNNVNELFKTFEGDDEVIIKCTAKNQAFKSPLKVLAGNHLLNELVGILGDENVVIK